MYATSAGKTASDGSGRNGVFTGELLKNLREPGLEVNEVFRRTGAEVQRVSNRQQIPAIYSQFFGTAYLGTAPQSAPQAVVQPVPYTPPAVYTGSLTVSSAIAGMVVVDGRDTGISVKAEGTVTIPNIASGWTEVGVRGSSGQVIPGPGVLVQAGQAAGVRIERPVPDGFVRIPGGTFLMGIPASEAGRFGDEGPQHQVTVSGFYMGKYEVTQKEWAEVMGSNPSNFKGDKLPVENVSWYDVIEYCNKRSVKEGLTPAYTRNGDSVTWNRGANGYRLSTEAEWEYACRAGTTTAFNTGSKAESLSGSANVADQTAKAKYSDWTIVEIRDGYAETAPVGSYRPNSFGLYDMHGNVYEWCWDWYGSYSGGAQIDPAGPASGANRVIRGGSWSYDAAHLRSASRVINTPGLRYSDLGFRLVRP
jgi:formylglycine-generating enzyme required for sulfatase activity